jgi:hypothetical protein
VTPLIVLALVVVVFFLFLLLQVRSRYFRPVEPERNGQLTPIDLEAFENLTDPDEEQYLKANLAPAAFREAQRARIRATKMYVAALAENAGVLVAVGQSARSHTDPEIAAAGLEIVQRALRIKVWCLFALLRLNAAILFPAQLSPSSEIANRYLLVTYMAANLPRKAAA